MQILSHVARVGDDRAFREIGDCPWPSNAKSLEKSGSLCTASGCGGHGSEVRPRTDVSRAIVSRA